MVKLDLGLVLVICGKLGVGGGLGDEVLLGRNIVNHVVNVNKGKMSMCESWPPIWHYFDVEFSS
jgi:hypothetical protein